MLGTLLGPEGVAAAANSGDLTVGVPPARLLPARAGGAGLAPVTRGGPPVS